MRKEKAIYIQILCYLLFIICTLSFLPDASKNLWQHLKDCVTYNENWHVETSTQSQDYETLPIFFYAENGGQDIWISKKLVNVQNDDCIGFFSFQQQVSILLDGETVYEFIPTDYANSSTPGNKWNFLPLEETDNEKTVTIHIFQCYAKGRVTIPTIYYGTQSGIALNYISSELPRVCLSLAMILFGVLIGLFCILYRSKTPIGQGLPWLALYAIFRGLWGTIESNLYSFFISRLLLVSQVSYLSLKLAVVNYLQFINCTFSEGKDRLLKILTVCSISEFWLTAILQLLGITDFANTVFLTHVIMLIAGVYACIIVLRAIHNERKDSMLLLSVKRQNTHFAQLFCTIVVVITSIIDMVRYYATNSPDVARYARIGDIIYVVTMSVALFLDFIYLIRMGHKAAIIREEASLDPMTKLRNRSSFEKDIEKGNRRDWKHKSIIILDLNNLKLFNDQHGHDAGDQYIVTASELIRDTFSPWGNAYRIGGDEFCIIAERLTEEKFLELRASIEEQMAAIHTLQDSLRMEVSSGFSSFDSFNDSTLRDTMKRADERMYQRKLELKGEAGR